MDDIEKKHLVIEHAQLVAALAAGNESVRNRLNEIEVKLNMSATEIAHAAVTEYLRGY